MEIKKVAITGGIGSGKTEVLKILNEKGYYTISCDKITNDLYFEQDFLIKLKNLFPFAVDEKGVANKKTIANEVFNNKESLLKLNALVHPLVLERIEEEIKGLNNIKDGLVFVEVPLLFESGFNKYFENIIVITRNLEDRVLSVIKRSNLSREEIENRINSQINYQNLPLNSYVTLVNDGSLLDLIKKIDNIVKNLI